MTDQRNTTTDAQILLALIVALIILSFLLWNLPLGEAVRHGISLAIERLLSLF